MVPFYSKYNRLSLSLFTVNPVAIVADPYPPSRTSSRAGSRHGSPRSGPRAFRTVHDHEYWNKLGLDEIYHTYAAVLECNGISPHQVILESKIGDFSHPKAGDAIAAVAVKFPLSVDASDDSDLDASR